MGAGLAKAFKARYPAAFLAYRVACREGRVRVGEVHLHRFIEGDRPRLIVHLPTKDDWRDVSQGVYVELGAVALRAALEERGVPSVAIPALGCGLGQLPWELVRWLLEGVFAGTAMDVELYEPTGLHAGTEGGAGRSQKGTLPKAGDRGGCDGMNTRDQELRLREARIEVANAFVSVMASHPPHVFRGRGKVARLDLTERGRVVFVDDYTKA